jgi:hypothetical protein
MSELPAAAHEFLLAFLALTSKYHSGLVAHHSPSSSQRPSNPLIAAGYYAAACRNRLTGSTGLGTNPPDLPQIQALLMLALHEWGDCDGLKSWALLGTAIRYAQLLGLHYESQFDSEPLSKTSGIDQQTRTSNSTSAEEFIAQETRRRTWWACFNLDRLLSTGKYRPQMIHVDDIRIQLPSSDKAFTFGEPVRTPLFSTILREEAERPSNGDRKGSSAPTTPRFVHSPSSSRDINHDDIKWEYGSTAGDLTRYLRAIEAYGTVVKWACAGGRL